MALPRPGKIPLAMKVMIVCGRSRRKPLQWRDASMFRHWYAYPAKPNVALSSDVPGLHGSRCERRRLGPCIGESDDGRLAGSAGHRQLPS
jgi:hypothetical protein